MRILNACLLAISLFFCAAARADVPLLLFDGETGRTFVGCLNCNRLEEASVCNKFGDYGSKFSDKSIWNQFGPYGSRFENNSPWSVTGNGLRIVDQSGNYYGRLTISPVDRSPLKIVAQIVAAHRTTESLDQLQEMLCGR